MDPASDVERPASRNPREVGDPCLAALRRWLSGQEGSLEEWLAMPERRDLLSEGVRQFLEEFADYVDAQSPGGA